MKKIISGTAFVTLILALVGLAGCASSLTATGEPGVKMGDSYAQVFAVVSRNNTVTKKIDGEAFRAEGYSSTFKDCRIKYFIFHGVDGLQQVSYDPAPHLSLKNNCRQP